MKRRLVTVVLMAGAFAAVAPSANAKALPLKLNVSLSSGKQGNAQVSVAVKTTRTARCSLTVRAGADTAKLPSLLTADGRGRWTWETAAPGGKWHFAARCARHHRVVRRATTALLLVPEGLAGESIVSPGTIDIRSGRFAKRLPSQSKVVGRGGGGGNPFQFGWCTWGAWEKAPWIGRATLVDAKLWADRAAKAGFQTGTTPVVGAIFVKTEGRYGHVGVVTGIIDAGTFTTVEMNGGRWVNAAAGKTTEFGKFVAHTRYTGPTMKFIYKPGTGPAAPTPVTSPPAGSGTTPPAQSGTTPPPPGGTTPPASGGTQPPSTPRTYPEQQGSRGVNTFTNPYNASGMGPAIAPNQWVEVACKVYAPQIQSANPDGYWYRIASAPWSGAYYSPANTFWNGDIPGHTPYTHNTDFAVPNC